MREIDAVLFDYGGVLTGPVKHSISGWLAADAIEPESFSRTLRAWLSRNAEDGTPVHRLETGELTVAEFERCSPPSCGPPTGAGDAGRDPAPALRGMQPDPAMFALAEELRATGLKVGLLSNSWGNTYPRERIDALFDPVVISGEVGLRKPHAAIYELALDQARRTRRPGALHRRRRAQRPRCAGRGPAGPAAHRPPVTPAPR